MGKLLWCGIVMVLLVSGCGWDGTPTRKNNITPITSITITPEYSTIAANTTTRLTVMGDHAGYFTDDVTNQVEWAVVSGPAEFNSVMPNRVKGTASGAVTLKATVKSTGVFAETQITVSSASISSIDVTPTTVSVPKGLNQQFKAVGTFSDLTTTFAQDITFDATWSSGDESIAIVSDVEGSKGFAKTDVNLGTTQITATFNDSNGSPVSKSADMTVIAPVVTAIAISPSNPTVLSIATKQFTATGTYSNGSTADITSQASWSSSNTTIATMNGGVASTLVPGTATISASFTSNGGSAVSGNSTLTVTGGSLSSISVTPATPVLVKDTKTRITATGTFTNGRTRDITGAVSWEPADTGLAIVTKAGGNLAWLTAVAGTSTGTTISAKASGVTGTATLNVTTPPTPFVTSIAIAPVSPTLLTGTSTSLVATAKFSNGAEQDVTALSEWKSDSVKATVGISDLAAGRVTGVTATGGAPLPTITATYGGKTDSTTVTVTDAPNLLSVAVSCPAVSVGNKVTCAVTATYSGLPAKDVTRDATAWTVGSENINILAVADSINQPGDVIGVSGGSTTLTATFKGMTAPAVTITVTP